MRSSWFRVCDHGHDGNLQLSVGEMPLPADPTVVTDDAAKLTGTCVSIGNGGRAEGHDAGRL